MAKKAAGDPGEKVSVRLLFDGPHGKCNEVVDLDAETAAGAVKAGHADDSDEAVAYARSLQTEEGED
jgi:hypothetical protein